MPLTNKSQGWVVKAFLLVLGCLCLISPVFADNFPKSDRFNATYDDVNDVTTISDKVTWGDSIPGTGDEITGHGLFLTLQIKFQGKKYNPDDPNTTVALMFIEMHFDPTDTSVLYEDQDPVALLVDGNRTKLGNAYYSQNVGGDAIIGKRELEILTIPVDLALLDTIAQAKVVKGAITAKNPATAGSFLFGNDQFRLVNMALDYLDAFKDKTTAK